MGLLLYHRTMPALPECVGMVRREMSSRLSAARVSRVFDIELVVTEAWMNAVLHAYAHRFPGQVEARVTIDGRHLSVAVTDRGRGFAPRVDSPGAGFGLPLMRSLASDVRISGGVDGAGTAVVCRFDDAAADATRHVTQPADRHGPTDALAISAARVARCERCRAYR